MTDSYLMYGEAYSSSRKTAPSQQPIQVQKKAAGVIRHSISTKSSGGSVVYVHKKSSFNQVRYVHKQDKNTVQAD
jgi:hypothetical protein